MLWLLGETWSHDSGSLNVILEKKFMNDREPCEYLKKSNTVIICQQMKLSKFYRNNKYVIDFY